MIYIHVPFCRSFCTYCGFYSEAVCQGKDEAATDRYVSCLTDEISSRRAEIEATLGLNTLYIGGGTPSILPINRLRTIVDALGYGPYEEFTVEVNPEDIVENGPAYVEGLLGLGVTRISMGVQSLDDGILRWMNRRHDAARAREAFAIISDCRPLKGNPRKPSRSARPHHSLRSWSPLLQCRGWHGFAEGSPSGGIDRSVDIITGVPGMGDESLQKTVEEILEWHPEHISAYQLGIDEGSALARMVAEGRVVEAPEEQCRRQYEFLCSRLSLAGYHHYEISNWAVPGHEAKHNSAYWCRLPYAGLGPGAHSLRMGPDGAQVRSWNSRSTDGWRTEGSETLTSEEIREEEIMLLARTDKGPIPEKDWFIADDLIADML